MTTDNIIRTARTHDQDASQVAAQAARDVGTAEKTARAWDYVAANFGGKYNEREFESEVDAQAAIDELYARRGECPELYEVRDDPLVPQYRTDIGAWVIRLRRVIPGTCT